MAILSKGQTFGANEQITSGKLHALVDSSTFVSGSTGTCETGGGLSIASSGRLQIEDGQIDFVKLSTDIQLNSGLYGIMNKVYPVGSVYISTVNTNPDTLFFGGNGDTTWEEYASGRMLLGFGQTTDSRGVTKNFASIGHTDGAYDHLLTINEMPVHNHNILTNTNPEVEYYGGAETNIREIRDGSKGAGGVNTTNSTENKGGGQIHNNMPPFIVTFMFKRTA
jgi:microcystin-dependent protein